MLRGGPGHAEREHRLRRARLVDQVDRRRLRGRRRRIGEARGRSPPAGPAGERLLDLRLRAAGGDVTGDRDERAARLEVRLVERDDVVAR